MTTPQRIEQAKKVKVYKGDLIIENGELPEPDRIEYTFTESELKEKIRKNE